MAGANTPNGANASVDAGLVWLADTVSAMAAASRLSEFRMQPYDRASARSFA